MDSPTNDADAPLANRPGPASDWLYAKLYCSPSHADRLLLQLVQPLMREALARGAVRRWFFIRYADPDWHLRLRCHGDPAALSSQVLPALLQRATVPEREGTLWRLEFDPYEPEVERYGGPSAIETAEALFQADSELSLALLETISGDEGAELRWRLGLCGVNRLLIALGLGIGERKTLAVEMARLREENFVVDEAYRRQMAERCRAGRGMVEALLTGQGTAWLPPEAEAALAAFATKVAPIGRSLVALDQAGQLTEAFSSLAGSLAHMHLNRLLRSRHIEQETVIWELLARFYASSLARGR